MARLFRMPTVPATTREMQLRTWVALGTRVSEGEFQAIAAEEWQALQRELRPAMRHGDRESVSPKEYVPTPKTETESK